MRVTIITENPKKVRYKKKRSEKGWGRVGQGRGGGGQGRSRSRSGEILSNKHGIGDGSSIHRLGNVFIIIIISYLVS
jgi:hypothetical protein